MAQKATLSARVSRKTMERLEDYADELGCSKSEAADRLVEQGLDVQESDMKLIPVRSDGGTPVEDKIESQGQQLQQKLESQTEKIEKLESRTDTDDELADRVQPWLIVAGLLFVVGELSFGFPTTFVVIVGLVIVAGMVMTEAHRAGYV